LTERTAKLELLVTKAKVPRFINDFPTSWCVI
jgi:hypothetical protein